MISPKVIDIGSNRIGDEIIISIGKKNNGEENHIYGSGKGKNSSGYYTINTGKFPTQLFTNIDLEYNGIKKIK